MHGSLIAGLMVEGDRLGVQFFLVGDKLVKVFTDGFIC